MIFLWLYSHAPGAVGADFSIGCFPLPVVGMWFIVFVSLLFLSTAVVKLWTGGQQQTLVGHEDKGQTVSGNSSQSAWPQTKASELQQKTVAAET